MIDGEKFSDVTARALIWEALPLINTWRWNEAQSLLADRLGSTHAEQLMADIVESPSCYERLWHQYLNATKNPTLDP